jgi:hypothetical protein
MNSYSRNQIIVGIFILFIIITGIFAWYKKSPSKNNLDYVSIPTNCDYEVDSIASLPAGEMEKERMEAIEESEKIKNYFNNENYAELEHYARMLRTEKTRFTYGELKLGFFYRTISYPAINEPGKATEGEWQKHLDSLKKWSNQNPQSITARVGMAAARMKYAAVKYSQGYTKPEEIQLYKNRTLEVAQILDASKTIPERCPHWYCIMLDVAYVNAWGVERYNQIFNEAINTEPFYEDLYVRKTQYLKKYVNDNKNEIAKFADEVALKLGGKEGSRMYYKITAAQADLYGIDVFNHTELSWEKVIEGYNASNELFGESATRLNYFCYLATAAHDVKTVRKLMKRIGNNVNTRIWSTKYYGKVKDWAFTGCKN